MSHVSLVSGSFSTLFLTLFAHAPKHRKYVTQNPLHSLCASRSTFKVKMTF